MLSVFFDRKDSGHIGQFHVIPSFEQPAQKIQVFFLYFFLFFCHTEHTVPFIDYKYKSFSRIRVYLFQHARKPIRVFFKTVSELFIQFFYNHVLYLSDKNTSMRFLEKKFLDIQADDLMPVQMFLVRCVFFNRQPGK